MTMIVKFKVKLPQKFVQVLGKMCQKSSPPFLVKKVWAPLFFPEKKSFRPPFSQMVPAKIPFSGLVLEENKGARSFFRKKIRGGKGVDIINRGVKFSDKKIRGLKFTPKK